MKIPRFYWYEWVMILSTITIIICLLTGCVRTAVPLPKGDASSLFSGGLGNVLITIAKIAAALASTGLIACGFLGIFYHDKAKIIQLLFACIATIAMSLLVYWLGNHLWILGIGCLGIIGIWAWAHVKLIEKWFAADLNRNGKIG